MAGLRDVEGCLSFASRPQDAPVIRFGGPWQLLLGDRQRLTVGRETNLTLVLGTVGLGPGTTAGVGYQGVVPEDVFPEAEVIYPPRREGEPPVTERYPLKHRC
jgi:hypothetical protein